MSFTAVVAQSAVCGATVQNALDTVGQSCEATGRNQACYGYVSLQAPPREGVQDFSFTQQGDLASVADLDTLRLSPFDAVNNTWGIALMKLQASLPDSLPGQNVTFLVFGDVEITNASAPGAGQPTIAVSAASRVNIRSTPSTSGAIIGTFAAGETATANGRNEDGTWLQIQLPDSDTPGWVFADVVTVSGDIGSLRVVGAAQAEMQYTPMQAFYFSSGIAQIGCQEAPQDGILIQTPKGVAKVDLRANDVAIQLGSTAYLQAQASDNMTVSVVEGAGQITTQGVSVDVPAGMFTTIPLDSSLRASGAPTPPQPYDAAQVAALPVSLLPDPITIAAPASEATPEATETPGGGGTAAGSTGPYTAQTTMNLGGVTVSGSVCTLEQPFEVTFTQTGIITWVIQFVPADAAHGTYSYSYSLADVGETARGEGTYTVSEAAADGSRTLAFEGTQTNNFTGGGVTMQLQYSFGLSPAASGACGGG
ncbi:MAG: SH3 domain-containing protein [Anaerolineae bacterium]|nr:SH3 domain-containing protein [Anaerolineae bacterium]